MPTTLFPGPIGIIDVETTGLFPRRHDRVLEVAVVVVDCSGRILREFVSLVNPGRDVGASSIHGLTAEDILGAPQFGEVAALLIEALQGTVAIAGHNVRFDRQFIECEFTRIDLHLPECPTICTMQLAGGGRLTDCCCDYGIPIDGKIHNALVDARATAQLLCSLLPDQPRIAKKLTGQMPIQWPNVPRTEKRPISRAESRRQQSEPPTYLQRLLKQKHTNGDAIDIDSAVIAYSALLDRVLEDRRIEESEADALCETAEQWGLTSNQIRQAHCNYFNQLASAAVADGIVTEAEQRDLKLVARLLGHDLSNLDKILNEAAAKVSAAKVDPSAGKVMESTLVGRRVCFTGEMRCCHEGQLISRERAESIASKAGLDVVDSVTKKLDLLVVADPHTQSGKAKKARQYGIRIIHEPVFWRAIGVEVS